MDSSHSSLSLRDGADYNIFGYDPNGKLSHLAAIFYGPAWQPFDCTHLLSFKGVNTRAPSYGPPTPHQTPWLPPDFTPCSPPLYYGYPRPPYLPGPKHFDPKALVALVLTASSVT